MPTKRIDSPGRIRSLRRRCSQLECSAMANWLFKEEPTHYNFDALKADGRTTWSGVRNPVAQKHLSQVRKGDRIFYYHTGDEKSVVAIAKAASDAYPDPEDA